MRLLDAYPVTVTVSGQDFSGARLIASDTHAQVFALVDGRPHMVAEAGLVEAVDGRREIRQVATDAGVWRVRRDGNCGCSGPQGVLKRMSIAGLAQVAEASRAVGE